MKLKAGMDISYLTYKSAPPDHDCTAILKNNRLRLTRPGRAHMLADIVE